MFKKMNLNHQKICIRRIHRDYLKVNLSQTQCQDLKLNNMNWKRMRLMQRDEKEDDNEIKIIRDSQLIKIFIKGKV